ncbi:MAG: Eco57I restriction-modification methylase domain-containing protein [Rikenellaceae bacterium]
MVRFAFNPNKSSRERIEKLSKQGVSATFSALFRPQSIEKNEVNNLHKKFVHETEVFELIEVIDGTKKDENLLGFLDYDKIKRGNMCRHIVCVLPYRASCDAFEDLLKRNRGKFKNLFTYEVINISGVEDPTKYDTESVKARILDCETKGIKTITLTVNKMLTGSTVEQWDTMLYLKDSASPQEYDQAIFRLQNQYIKSFIAKDGKIIKYNMKPQTLLVDFNPNRMFYMQEQKSQIYNVNVDESGNDKLEERLREELRISPIIVLNENKIKEVTPTDILSVISEYSQNKSVNDEAKGIPIDVNLLFSNKELLAEIGRQNPIDSKGGLKIPPVQGDEDEIDTTSKDDNDIDNTESKSPKKLEPKEERKEWEDKFKAYYTRILFFAFLTNSKVSSLRKIIEVIDSDEDNVRIAKHIDIKKSILEILLLMNPFNLSGLDYKIWNINRLANDKDKEPLNRCTTAMCKFGRMSESEIVTPLHIAEEMVATLPDSAMRAGNNILDINSKQGEFAIVLYKRSNGTLKDTIYSIPSSPIAYEFTRKIYEALEMPIENIFKGFISYDIIEDNNTEIIERLQNMKFNTVVGNPPYQANDGGGMGSSALPIYQDFVKIAKTVCVSNICMIMPSRWFTGGRGLDEFRDIMLQDKNIRRINDYPNASDCFPGVEIKGGVCFFLRGEHTHDLCTVNTIVNDSTITANRPLLELGSDIFIRDSRAISILRKVQMLGEDSFSNLISANDPFGFDIRESGSYKRVKQQFVTEPFDGAVKFYYNGWRTKGVGYIKEKEVRKNKDIISGYKILVPKAWGVGNVFTDWLKPFIVEGKSCCTETYLLVGTKLKKREADNIISYTQTRFFHLMLSLMKLTQNTMQKAYSFIPIQDFTKVWNDEKLYKKYKLTPDEINFIESTIKPME